MSDRPVLPLSAEALRAAYSALSAVVDGRGPDRDAGPCADRWRPAAHPRCRGDDSPPRHDRVPAHCAGAIARRARSGALVPRWMPGQLRRSGLMRTTRGSPPAGHRCLRLSGSSWAQMPLAFRCSDNQALLNACPSRRGACPSRPRYCCRARSLASLRRILERRHDYSPR